MVEYGEVESREEYESLWKSTYPEENCWYEVVIVEGRDYRGVSIGHNTIISALMDEEPTEQDWKLGDISNQLITLMMDPIRDSLEKLQNGMYNEWVSSSLPYQFRTGMIKRSVLWQYEPGIKNNYLDGLSPETIKKFKELIKVPTAGHIKSFTANDFFKACEIGYRAIGKDCSNCSLSELYLRYSDGRNEGLTGKGHNDGPGIDFDSPQAWDEWYFGHRGGGHPWEVVPGGNSTHMDLFVCHDRNDLDWRHRAGQISDEDYENRMKDAGYYYEISGKHRPFESVSFYVALSLAGLPVVLNDADEIMARIDGTDFVGIVPHHTIPKYCEGMFPGKVIDFMHVYDEDMVKYGDEIEWLPEKTAELKS